MRTLTLMRHAKSSWDDPGLSDHDRPLNARGRDAARTMACRLYRAGYCPGLMITSTARRAVETGSYFFECCPGAFTWKKDPRLYEASAGTYGEIIREVPSSVEHLFIIAHNPTLETVAVLLGTSGLRLPTAAYVRFAVEESWDAFSLQSHERLDYDFPKSGR